MPRLFLVNFSTSLSIQTAELWSYPNHYSAFCLVSKTHQDLFLKRQYHFLTLFIQHYEYFDMPSNFISNALFLILFHASTIKFLVSCLFFSHFLFQVFCLVPKWFVLNRCSILAIFYFKFLLYKSASITAFEHYQMAEHLY